jgi:hypothetical protein
MFNKYNISLMNEKWEMINQSLKVKYIPRSGEFIYLNNQEQYYKVVNVIHSMTKKHEIFIIIEIFDKKNSIKNH